MVVRQLQMPPDTSPARRRIPHAFIKPTVRMELRQADERSEEASEVDKVRRTHKYWLGAYGIIALAFLAFHVLVRMRLLDLGERTPFFRRTALAAFLVFLILFVSQFVLKLVVRSSRTRVFKYNALRVVRLVAVLLVVIVSLSYLFHNWYAAAVSLGLISLVLGFALQGPISSFIGWLYILFRSPFQVGDRIEIGDVRGDVLEVSYLDTTLSEFRGTYLSSDLPSGRLVRFPNSMVLQSAVFNYSWQEYPFIWKEIAFQVAYNSDLDLVLSTLRRVTREELDPEITGNVQELKDLIRGTPVGDLPLKEYPIINLRISSNTWVEAVVTYLVHPKGAGATRTRIIQKALRELNREPGRVLFPKGENR
jgi:small-conductance mechanosensitive channel